jgi:hypothetical protein
MAFPEKVSPRACGKTPCSAIQLGSDLVESTF